MASESQIEANRRNAQKSSGPRSDQGKQRASNNAYRHGLFSGRTRVAMFKETESFACKIADETLGTIALEQARIVAESENELTLVRRAICALIDRTDIFGDFNPPPVFNTDVRKKPGLMTPAQERRYQFAKDLLTPEQHEEAARSVAIKRVMRELNRLSLYGRRAAARRDRAIRRLIAIKRAQKDLGADSNANSQVDGKI
jgi:hypothetical protein